MSLTLGDIVLHSYFYYEIPLIFIGNLYDGHMYTGIGLFLLPDGSLHKTFMIENNFIVITGEIAEISQGAHNVSID